MIARARRLVIDGHTFGMNRHGVVLLARPGRGDGWDGFWYWPGHGAVDTDEQGAALRRRVRAAFDSAGLRATCAPSGACGCAPRF